MRNLYKYTGTISSFTFRRTIPNQYLNVDMILSGLLHDEKAPVRLEAHGGLAEYINNIEHTDAEERYITCDWYYDSLLWLYRIEVPSSNPNIPAKIITQFFPLDLETVIFGPTDYIKTTEPAPMENEQFSSWCDFHRQSMDKTNWR